MKKDKNMSFTCEENWARYVIKGTLNMKVYSGRPKGSTIKHDHRLKMTVFKGIRKCFLSTSSIQNRKNPEE